MLYASFRDGTVRRYDLRVASEHRDWVQDHRHLRGQITALALGIGAHRADLPRPRRFRSVVFSAEVVRDPTGAVVAEKAIAICDGVVVSLVLALGGRLGRFRLDVDSRGIRRFDPGSS